MKWWSNHRAGELRCKCGQRVVWVHDVADEQLGLQLQPGVCVAADKSHSGTEAADCDTCKHSSDFSFDRALSSSQARTACDRLCSSSHDLRSLGIKKTIEDLQSTECVALVQTCGVNTIICLYLYSC